MKLAFDGEVGEVLGPARSGVAGDLTCPAPATSPHQSSR